MTIQRNLNQSGLGGNYAIWYLIKTLEAAGWTILSSGSGTGGVYEAAGDVFDPADNPKTNTNAVNIGVGSGSEHFGNEACWVRMEDPASNREILFVRSAAAGDAADANWWFGWSESTGFIAGAPAAGTPPDAADERNASSSGTKAAPGALMVAGGTSNLMHIAADDTASPAGEYGFVMLEMETVNQLSSIICLDDIRDHTTGDPAPLTIGLTNTPRTAANMYGAASGFNAVFDNGGGGELYEDARYMANYAGDVYANRGRQSVYDSKERPIPYPVVGYNIGGFIGMSRWFRQPGVARDYPNTGDTESLLYLDEIIIVDLLDGLTTPNAI